MKKIFFFIVVSLFYLFLPNDVFAQHACNEPCGGAADITCSETTGQLTYNRGSCNSGLACHSGSGNRCRNPYCPGQTNCVCPKFTIQGIKQPNIDPFSNQQVFLDGVSPITSIPYFFTNVTANTVHRVSASKPPGSSVGYTICYDDINCHSNTPTLREEVYICTNQAPDRVTDLVDLWWHYTPLIPNCKDIKVNNRDLPYTVLKGDTVNLSAVYENYNGPLTDVGMVVNPQGSCSFTPLNIAQSGGSGTHTFSWTPTQEGVYDVFCRAWNDGIAECRGLCVDGPPRYQCHGPSAWGTITVQNPGPWYKLKNTSLNKVGSHNISVVQNVNKFTDSDQDDTNQRYVIISSRISDPGLILTTDIYNPGPIYNPIRASRKNWYSSNYQSFRQTMIDNFYQYVVSRKENKTINDISEINKNGIYIIKNDNLLISTQPPAYDFILIVRNSSNRDYGGINVNVDNFNQQLKSVMILAKNISFSSVVNYANGIFIAENINYQTNNGLKITGNLISKNSVTLQSRTDNTRPSLFIVFSKKMYLDLLLNLSIARYDWQQSQ